MNQKIESSFRIFVLTLIVAFANSQAQAASPWGGTMGISAGLGTVKNSDLQLNSRMMTALSLEGLVGYRFEKWLLGFDLDYRIQNQLTGLSDAGGTNLKGESWIFGVGAQYLADARWSVQGSVGFLGQHSFGRQTSKSEDDHLSSPLAIRLKPQFFIFDHSRLSADLDLRYLSWSKFVISQKDLSKATSEVSIGLGITYHFNSTPEPISTVPSVPSVPLVAPSPSLSTTTESNAELSKILDSKTTDHGLMLNLSGASFESGSAELNESAKDNLIKIAKIIAAEPTRSVRIEGYSDASGSEESNAVLSKERALKVRELFIAHQVIPQQVSAEGMGSKNPIADNEKVEGRALNRRVEIYITEGTKNEN